MEIEKFFSKIKKKNGLKYSCLFEEITKILMRRKGCILNFSYEDHFHFFQMK